ncbi:MAG: hypothetical protein JWN44_3104 [Myxococcales bacterium]|nr:hypothetical protein [Myxococcales bacterium]
MAGRAPGTAAAGAVDAVERAEYAAPMKSTCAMLLVGYCAIASSGCGSSAGGKDLLGSYTVQISTMGKSDPDVMTVSPAVDGKFLLTFAAGITTDVGTANANGLRMNLDSSKVSLDKQPANIDHSTGYQTGSVTGDGVLMGDGTCDIFLHFTPTGGAAQDYEIVGAKM